MRHRVSLFAAAIALTAVAAPRAHAQTSLPTEWGVDAGISFGLDDPKATIIDIPARTVRAGFFVSPTISIEPQLGINSVHAGGETSTIYRASVGLLWHLPYATPYSGAYLRPFAGISGVSASGTSDSNGLLGAGIGYKYPIIPQLSARFEANYEHDFGSNGTNYIGLLAGLSFFTH